MTSITHLLLHEAPVGLETLLNQVDLETKCLVDQDCQVSQQHLHE